MHGLSHAYCELVGCVEKRHVGYVAKRDELTTLDDFL
jgi:hypothetical protein